ncbi:MAG: hypothetical protein LBS61_05355 [Endomicrobium sp.]|jgi:hypothetical protein|nr:hypothetical protein [Endomicrobium sp.]
MLKKLASMLLALLVSVSGRAVAQEQSLTDEDEMKQSYYCEEKAKRMDGGTCKKPETTWQRVKRKASEIKQWILENKWKCIIGIVVCVGGGMKIYKERRRSVAPEADAVPEIEHDPRLVGRLQDTIWDAERTGIPIYNQFMQMYVIRPARGISFWLRNAVLALINDNQNPV